MHIFKTTALLLTTALISSACSTGLLSVHKIDVQQGNALEPEMANQVRVGMNTEQVEFLLGHPMVHDSFHQNRWDYMYYFKPGDGKPEKRRMTVFFENGEVTHIEKANFPKDKDTVAAN